MSACRSLIYRVSSSMCVHIVIYIFFFLHSHIHIFTDHFLPKIIGGRDFSLNLRNHFKSSLEQVIIFLLQISE